MREKILQVEQLKFTRNKSEFTINISIIEKYIHLLTIKELF